MSYLLDTNVISELSKPTPNSAVVKWIEQVPSESLFLSALTLGEIRKGVELLKDEHKKSTLRTWLEHDLTAWFDERILPINNLVADRWGRLLAEMKRSVPAIDSLIAATALHFDLSLVTRNVSDFQYDSLIVIDPWN